MADLDAAIISRCLMPAPPLARPERMKAELAKRRHAWRDDNMSICWLVRRNYCLAAASASVCARLPRHVPRIDSWAAEAAITKLATRLKPRRFTHNRRRIIIL